MTTLAELIAMRDALEAARFRGVTSVAYTQGNGSRQVTYKSDADMKAALLDLNRKIAAASAPAGSPFVSFTTSKGL